MIRPTHTLAVRITRYVDDGFPGWVESEFLDADGHLHRIVDKIPIFTTEMLDSQSSYPSTGDIPCLILEEWRDSQGREVARITTHGIESTERLCRFVVFRNQLSDLH